MLRVIDQSSEARILARSEHPISRNNIADNALKVLYRLNRGGYKACLVGGSVRDLMLGREPKDFDAGTDASPAQIRRLFRNSRIIGRRFRLAHIFFSDGIVEVATFRCEPSPEEQKGGPGDLLITSDNEFGTPRQDAFRRDFTVNGLFYDISDYSVIDYVGGIEDLERQLIRCIGEPEVRFKEDPVRMLRACEFAARLGFGIESRTQEGIISSRGELLKASSARMTEELIQLLKCGHAGAAFQWMLDLGLLDSFVPEVKVMLDDRAGPFGDLSGILPVLDSLVQESRVLSDGAILSPLLLPTILVERHRVEERDRKPMRRAAIETLIHKSLQPFLDRFSLSNAKAQALIQALMGFQRLCEPRWSDQRRQAFARRRCFTDSLVLFEIMVEATGEGREELDRWRQVKPVRRASRGRSDEESVPPDRRRRRRRRRRGGSRNSQSRQESV